MTITFTDGTITTSAGITRAVYRVKGILVNGLTAGTLIPRIKREVVGTGSNVRSGSWGKVRKISA